MISLFRAPNKDLPAPQKDEGIDFNLMTVVGSLLHQGKQTKDASEDKTESAVKDESADIDEKKEVQDQLLQRHHR
jgi:hypothetical protein